MKKNGPIGFSSVAEYLAHALALEQELVERYQELADCMEVHHNPDVASLFRRLSQYGEAHAMKHVRDAEGAELPMVPHWGYQWHCVEGLENCREDAHYQMASYQALELALCNEACGCRFYVMTVEGSPYREVKKLASEMVVIKEEHLALLRGWHAREAKRVEPSPEDLDPPNMPE